MGIFSDWIMESGSVSGAIMGTVVVVLLGISFFVPWFSVIDSASSSDNVDLKLMGPSEGPKIDEMNRNTIVLLALAFIFGLLALIFTSIILMRTLAEKKAPFKKLNLIASLFFLLGTLLGFSAAGYYALTLNSTLTRIGGSLFGFGNGGTWFLSWGFFMTLASSIILALLTVGHVHQHFEMDEGPSD